MATKRSVGGSKAAFRKPSTAIPTKASSSVGRSWSTLDMLSRGLPKFSCCFDKCGTKSPPRRRSMQAHDLQWVEERIKAMRLA